MHARREHTTNATHRDTRRPTRNICPPAAQHETERQFQAAIIELATYCGWRCYHPWLSVHSASGWPDLVLVRGSRLLAIECKSERGRLSVAQRDWLAALGQVRDVEVFCWRPSMWAEIEHTLR